MDLPVNRFKRALREGGPQVGLWSVLANAGATELLGAAGFDWLCIDMEHAPNELPDVQAQLQALRGSGTSPVVRPPWNDMVWVKRVLDLGAQTLLIPYVQTAAEAAQAVSNMRYPPAGRRGVAGGTRATQWGRIRDYYVRAEDAARRWLEAGCNFVAVGVDAVLLAQAADGLAGKFRT